MLQMGERRLADFGAGDWESSSSAINKDVPAREIPGKIFAVVFGREENIRRAPQELAGVISPPFRVFVITDVGHDVNVCFWVQLANPSGAEFSWNRLLGTVADDYIKRFDLRKSSFDQ
jgi:hypothetical protein